MDIKRRMNAPCGPELEGTFAFAHTRFVSLRRACQIGLKGSEDANLYADRNVGIHAQVYLGAFDDLGCRQTSKLNRICGPHLKFPADDVLSRLQHLGREPYAISSDPYVSMHDGVAGASVHLILRPYSP
jgi:hypothetical protein